MKKKYSKYFHRKMSLVGNYKKKNQNLFSEIKIISIFNKALKNYLKIKQNKPPIKVRQKKILRYCLLKKLSFNKKLSMKNLFYKRLKNQKFILNNNTINYLINLNY